MTNDLREKPLRVRSPRGARVTEIDWADGHKGIYPHAVLRGFCPCAGCQGHSGEIKFVPVEGTGLELEEIEKVGSYALRLAWFDGHGSGIYSYRYLRSLCRCSECHREDDPASESKPA
jgi:DUF971 family protein